MFVWIYLPTPMRVQKYLIVFHTLTTDCVLIVSEHYNIVWALNRSRYGCKEAWIISPAANSRDFTSRTRYNVIISCCIPQHCNQYNTIVKTMFFFSNKYYDIYSPPHRYIINNKYLFYNIFSFVSDVAIQYECVQRLGQSVLHSNEVNAD